MRNFWHVLSRVFREWNLEEASRQGAALAYYTVLSVAPLLQVVLSIVSLAFGKAAGQQQLSLQLQGWLGPDVAKTVESTIANANKPSAGIIATLVGLIMLFIGTSGVVSELKASLNRIWGVPRSPGSMWATVRLRATSFALVLGVGFILLASLVLSTGIASFGKYLSGWLPVPEALLTGLDFVLSVLIVAWLFAFLFRFLPDVWIPWTDVWVGAVATAVLFTIGKIALAFYLGKAAVGSAYGAAGSVIVLLVWIYYASQLFLFGAKFTQIYAADQGSRASRQWSWGQPAAQSLEAPGSPERPSI